MSRLSTKIKKKDPTAERADALGGGSNAEFSSSPNIPKKQGKRYLSWTFVGYPDSLPENWLNQLADLCVPYCVSPIHDKDLTGLGEPKKPHYHVLLSFRSVKSFEQIKEITDKLNAPIPQPCNETRGLVRYFLHLDHPNKAQYSRDDIIAGCGFDLENALQATATEEEEILDEICDFLESNWITEFAAANSWIRHNRKEWRLIFRKNAFYLSQIIKSQRHQTETKTRREG